MKKLALVLAMLPLAAWADVVPIYQHVEIYHWSKGEFEVYSILVAFVVVGVCLLVGVMSKLRKRTIGTMTLGVFMTAAIFYMSICHACGGKGRSVGAGERMCDRFPALFGVIGFVHGEIKVGKICRCCQGSGFHLPWSKRCVDNELEHREFFEGKRSTHCSRCGTRLEYALGRYCPKCNPRHSEDRYRFSDREAIGTE